MSDAISVFVESNEVSWDIITTILKETEYLYEDQNNEEIEYVWIGLIYRNPAQ